MRRWGCGACAGEGCARGRVAGDVDPPPTASDGSSGTLLALARAISDDEHICYVQDVVVDPAHHRQGIGRALIEHLMRRYSHCRFFLLSTDHESSPEGRRNHAFYRSLGFLSYEEKQMAGLGLPRHRPDVRETTP
ncbi:GNAT family N-acetyltransferase [Streptomyces antibioticus]|uniref:GNAT family N-acetyltransferase n=1 Tax=Streptomyces antibioticus TaxID=1890 RepID=UPI00224D5605|nr:GNAT family N-acetyltransferase [Streptomyces antibioticus]MCX5166557.1 GNAT family N-acetyltransferase [Streptomyces antibioticus]